MNNEKYDYEEAVKADLRQYLFDRIENADWTADEAEEERDSLYDKAFVSDSVTGNASGSYFFSTWRSEEAVCHNLDLLREAMEEFCVEAETFYEKFHGEWADVTIRCYVLGQVFGEVFDEVIKEIRDNRKAFPDEKDED